VNADCNPLNDLERPVLVACQPGQFGKLDLECKWLPGLLKLSARSLALSDYPDLADAQVRRVTGRESAEVVAVGEDRLHGGLKSPQRFDRLRRQPERALPRCVSNEAKLAQRGGQQRIWRS
jgi:hypothetical protein